MADSEQRSSAGTGPKGRRDESPKHRADDAPNAGSGDGGDGGEDGPRRDDAPRAGTVGELLAQARIAQDLSVEQLAAELRIEARQLVALEQNRFERIGVPVFVKGYIKQYGTRLGLDTSDLLAAYYKQGKLEDIDIRPSRPITVRDQPRVSGWLVALLVLLAIVGALALWWLNGEGFNGIAPSFGRSVPAAVPAAALPAPAERAQDAAADRVQVEAPPAAADPALAPPAEQPTAAPAPDGAVAPEAGVPPPSDTRAGAALRPLAFAVDVDVAFEQDSWAEITDARGERLYYGLGSAGRRATLRGEPPLAVVLGNADGVRIKIEGADYDIPRPKQGNFARFSIDVNED
ncbi:MAG TPA: RodZ domain-containing protein [Gammaproteobacteria bacterium]|nr:RodZ domain-containing protein [Gammaproteobacteria bacterium]